MFYLECVLEHGGVVRMLFASKIKAENARKKIAAEMNKGRFGSKDDVVEIVSDASTYSLVASKIATVSVNDQDKWLQYSADNVATARNLGIPVPEMKVAE